MSDINGTVVAIQGYDVSDNAPSNGDMLMWDSSEQAWIPVTAQGSPTGPASGDLLGDYPDPILVKISIGGTFPITAEGLQFTNNYNGFFLSQDAEASTSIASGATGGNILIKSQQGQNATGGGHAGGNGGNVILQPGAGGTSSASVAGKQGVIYLNGSQRIKFTGPITGNFTVPVGGDYLYGFNIGGAMTVTLQASPTVGDTYIFKDIVGNLNGTDTITIDANGSTIDGASTKVMNTAYACVKIVYTGSYWNLI